MPVIHDQTVWLPGLVRENPWLDGFTFERCTLVGPIVLAFGAGDNNTLDRNSFDGGNLDSILIAVPEGARITWAVGLRNVVMRECRLQGVGLVGAPEQVAAWRAGFA